jgi:hypothetical protein
LKVVVNDLAQSGQEFSLEGYRSTPLHRQYDVTPDDQRFVMLRMENEMRDELILVKNFFEELKAKVGR